MLNKRLYLRGLYYRYSLLRKAVNFICQTLQFEKPPTTAHLIFVGEEALGPLQRDEARLLLSLIQVVRPQTVVEFGFSSGVSAFNFLQALGKDAHLYSYDIGEYSRKIAHTAFRGYKNFHFFHKSQDAFSPEDIEGKKIDFAFIDGAHDEAINQRTFKAILPHLSETAIIAVHDTGTWNKKHFLPIHQEYAARMPENWLNKDEFQVFVEERRFTNWIADTYPEFQLIHLHSQRCLRHGLTLLQRNRLLATK